MKLVCKLFLNFLFSLCLISCFNDDESDAILIGTSADNPPYEFIQNEEVVGFDIDLIKEIGKIIGKKVKIVNIDFPTLIAALNSKKVDIVIAGLSITEDRIKYVDFSHPYITTNISLIYDNSRNKYSDINEIRNAKIGAQTGSTFAMAAEDLIKANGGQLIKMSNNLHLIEELKKGEIDLVSLEDAQASKFVSMNNRFSKISMKNKNYNFAIAFRKSSPLTKSVNDALEKMKEKNENGKIMINELIKKWGI